MYVSRFFFPRFFWRRTSVSRRRRHGGTGGRRFAPPSAAGRLRAAFGRRLMDKTSLSFAFVSLKLWIAGCLASTSHNSVLFDLQLSDRSEACAFQGPPARCFDTADLCTVDSLVHCVDGLDEQDLARSKSDSADEAKSMPSCGRPWNRW